MKQQYRAVVIGGGVVGASVLYHLAKFGWSDIALIERSELTAGSTWHAAAGFHALNADPNIASLQDYTIKLYPELERESGQSCGLHMTGGLTFASTPDRWRWLQSAWAVFQAIGVEDSRLAAPEEIAALNPLLDMNGILGGMLDANEGYLDPNGTTYAYAKAAQKRGAAVILRNRVIAITPRATGGFDLETEQGMIFAEHVVNAGGLWAKQVGRMVGLDLPVTPMEHHYLVTETIPELAARSVELPVTADLDGFSHPIRFGSGSWTTATGVMSGTFTQPMPIGDGQSIPPTNARFVVGMVTIGHWVNGKMDHEWLFYDNADFMKQIGLGK